MSKKTTLYTLNGCGFCESLITSLKESNILYTYLECGEDNKYCEELESITNCRSYPMAIIEKNPFERIIVCISNDYEKIKEIKKIDRKTILIHVHSTLSMLDVIKNV